MLPEIGTVKKHRGQPYKTVGYEPYRCRNGRLVTLVLWRSHCPDCGQPFVTKTLRRLENPARRCEKHRRPGVRVPHDTAQAAPPVAKTSRAASKKQPTRPAPPPAPPPPERTADQPLRVGDFVMDGRCWCGRVTRILLGRYVRVRWDRGGGAVLPVGKLTLVNDVTEARDLEFMLS